MLENVAVVIIVIVLHGGSALQSNLPEWIPLKWITRLNGCRFSGPV